MHLLLNSDDKNIQSFLFKAVFKKYKQFCKFFKIDIL